tara:strand:+ start:2600 stop:4219 length:1620 start_codon:yes stop_codon:yes gene_type:complete
MILLATDYSSTAELTAAIDTYLSNAADIYVTKATYDISRDCDQTDFFINVLHHQVKNGYQDRELYSGFDDYVTPPPVQALSYLDGFNTTYGTQPATYTEGSAVTITVISGNSDVQILNTDITLTFGTEVFTVTANAQGTATFTFTPTTQGPVTVTSALSSSASNAIALGYHGLAVDTSTYSIDSTATYGTTLNSGIIAVGDFDAGGTINFLGDIANALAVYNSEFRLKFTKHATVEIGSLFYNPGVGGSLSYTLTPVSGDYTYGANSGQSKSIADLSYNYAVTDSDGAPVSSISSEITHAANTLAADGSFTGSIPISAAFNNPVLVVFALIHAYNKAVITTQSIAGLSAAITDKASFEPGDTVVVTVSDDAGEDANVTGSLLYLEGYATSALTGTPLVTTAGFVTATNAGTLSLAIPSTLDQDLFLKTGYTFYTVINSITVEYLAGTIADVASIMVIAADVTHYTAVDQTITVTVTMQSPYSRTGYKLTLRAQEVGTSNLHALATDDQTSAVSYTFQPNSGDLTGTKSIVLNASLVAGE